MKAVSTLIKALLYIWLFFCVFGGLVSLRYGDLPYSFWVIGSSWPAVLGLSFIWAIKKFKSKGAE